MIILALDVASVTGVAEGEPGGTPTLSTVRFAQPNDGPFEAFGRATKWAARRVSREPQIMAAYIEAPAIMKWGKTNHRTTEMLRGLRACVAGVMRARDIPVHDASIRAVRACFIGNGNLPGVTAKAESMRIAKLLGWNPKNLDEADAAGIWFWASSLYDNRIRPPSEHFRGALL